MSLNGIVRGSLFAALGMAATGAYAQQEVNLQGTASGYFNASGTSVQGLSYSGSAFNVTTSGGFFALGSNASSPNINNLGSITLTGNPATYFGDTFTLDVNFTTPTGITNGTGNVYTATVIGQVASNDNGGVFINFNNSPKTFTFSNGSQTGFFDLNVNNVSLTPGHLTSVTGYGFATAQAVPEPASMFCIVTGLAGVVLKRRKK